MFSSVQRLLLLLVNVKYVSYETTLFQPENRAPFLHIFFLSDPVSDWIRLRITGQYDYARVDFILPVRNYEFRYCSPTELLPEFVLCVVTFHCVACCSESTDEKPAACGLILVWRGCRNMRTGMCICAMSSFPEAEFLDVIGTKVLTKSFPSCYSQSSKQTDFTPQSPPPPPPLSKSGLKLVCYVNILYGNLKSENSKDFALEAPRKLCVHEFDFRSAFIL
jgi:hypothetical protein